MDSIQKRASVHEARNPRGHVSQGFAVLLPNIPNSMEHLWWNDECRLYTTARKVDKSQFIVSKFKELAKT